MTPREKHIRELISFMTSEESRYYSRGDFVYVDTSVMGGRSLMHLEGPQFLAFMLGRAKQNENILLKSADATLVIDHVRHYAKVTSKPLSKDMRSCFVGDDLYVNTGWADGKTIVVPGKGEWREAPGDARIFEPLPEKMRMPVPVMREAELFPDLLKTGIADFGDKHCLIAVTCATMLLPAEFPHPFIVFTGDQARGKSTTMKLLMQLVDPYESGELMTVGEDMRDIIALVRTRHSIALDNVSRLPFEEDLLSKMYSGGNFSARKMTTNAELSEVELPRLRVFMNGIGSAFSRSDLMSRCIFIDHPVLTTKDENNQEQFRPLHIVESRWQRMLPELLGSLLRATGAGLQLFRERGGYEGQTSTVRFAEYAILGECIAEAMGFDGGVFTAQVNAAGEEQKQGAIEADDCAQLVMSYLDGERAIDMPAGLGLKLDEQHEQLISPTELYAEIKALASSRGYAQYTLKWLGSVRAFSNALMRSRKNIENGGWVMHKMAGGENKRKLKFTRA